MQSMLSDSQLSMIHGSFYYLMGVQAVSTVNGEDLHIINVVELAKVSRSQCDDCNILVTL